MARLPQPLGGTEVLVKQRPLRFSFWPMYRGTRRYGLQSSVFATDPWTVISASIRERCPSLACAEAEAYLEQARDFYLASQGAAVIAARPLLQYYCYLNLVKAFILTKGIRQSLGVARHGIGEVAAPTPADPLNATLRVFKSPGGRGEYQVFDEFQQALGFAGLGFQKDYEVVKVLPQVVAGHRLWASAAGRVERFVALHEARIMEDKPTRALWLRLYLVADDLTRLSLLHKQLVADARLQGKFQQVCSTERFEGRQVLWFEQMQPLHYGQRASDKVQELVASAKQLLWCTVASVPPYRRFYLYVAPAIEHGQVLPQLLSVYLVTYYLGSITRYRPHYFDAIAKGKFGARIEEFIAGQPTQFIYLLASEFAQQNVTKPSIV